MIAILNLSIEARPSGLFVSEVNNAAYTDLCAQIGMVGRAWQLPQHDVRFVAAVGLERREVMGAVSEYLNGLLAQGRVG